MKCPLESHWTSSKTLVVLLKRKQKVKINRIRKQLKPVFFDENEYPISQNIFNQKMTTGTYVFREKTSPNGKNEIHLVSTQQYVNQIKETDLSKLNLKDLNGNDYTKESLKGKVITISFWTVPETNSLDYEKMEALNLSAQKYMSNTDVMWLAVSVDPEEELSLFLKENNWILNAAADQQDLANSFDILSYLTHIIVNKKGEIANVLVNESLLQFSQKMNEQIQTLINE